METSTQFLLTIGGILLLGLATSALSKYAKLPRVTLLLIFGILIGSEALDLIPLIFSEHFKVIADMTLLIVGFLIGGRLTGETFRSLGNRVFWISLIEALLTACIVSLLLIAFGTPLEIAIILGAIASASAPAAVLDVIEEVGAKGRFSKLLVSIVALDDVWALIIYGIGIAVVSAIVGNSGGLSFIGEAFFEVGGAILLGVLVGIPASYLTGRINEGQPMLIEALGVVFFSGGLALYFGVSYLITAITLGAIITNFAKHHEYPFHAIEGVERPFMLIFFTLAGASLELGHLEEIGAIILLYIIARVIGKYLGTYIGCATTKTDKETKRWMGAALLPQAGVSIGMALVAAHEFPQYKQIILSAVICSTLFFEIIGPIFTKQALKRGGSFSE